MTLRLKLVAAGVGLAIAGAAGMAAPAFAVDFLGTPLWESYPGQYGYYYGPAPPGPRWYYDPYSGRYYRRF